MPKGIYSRDICPKCGGHLVEKNGLHFFKIQKAILFMKCEKCGEIIVDIGESKNYKWMQKREKEKREKDLKERSLSLF